MRLKMYRTERCRFLLLSAAIASAATVSAQEKPPLKLDPSTMPKLGTVDPRYLSYNIEMVEVTGGRFWKPYNSAPASDAGKSATPPNPNQPVGLDSNMFQYRPPIDLANPRLRKLAATLGPSYVRVSGTWANSTYFQDDDSSAAAQAPTGFKTVLTRAEWKGVIDFARAANAQIVTSVAISDGTRNDEGIWSPDQAKAFFAYTKRAGGNIAASEFMNEPTFPGPGGAPKGYDATAFGRDARIFESFLRKESPKTVFLGPGSVGEGISLGPPGMAMQITLLNSDDLLKATGPIFDAFSYHFYGTVSRRCGGKLTIDQALSADWLDRTDTVEAYYANLRDRYLPGKPMWLNETAEAACGGDPFAGQFVDTFRFLNQLGTLAQKGVKVVMHNTLAASDYSLLTNDTFQPKPDFWAAVLWKLTMGTTVLDPGTPSDSAMRIYAHCAKATKDGVTLLVLNTDKNEKHSIVLPAAADRYTLTADALDSTSVSLNGTVLQAAPDGSFPPVSGQPVNAGTLSLDPQSITFLTISAARNKSCQGNSR
jgi:heparanase